MRLMMIDGEDDNEDDDGEDDTEDDDDDNEADGDDLQAGHQCDPGHPQHWL